MKHKALSKERARLKELKANTPVVVPCGKYSYENSLVMRVCEAGDLLEDAARLLEERAESFGFGEEYNKICGVLGRLNNYHEKSLQMLKTGKDWGVMPEPRQKNKQKNLIKNSGVFGRSWDEIEKMQGGKLSRWQVIRFSLVSNYDWNKAQAFVQYRRKAN